MITEPGVDKCLRQGPAEVVEAIHKKLSLSILGHGSSLVAVVGHFDCLINPATKEQHWEDIAEAARVVASWGLQARVVGLYVNEWFAVDLVSDTEEKNAIRAFL